MRLEASGAATGGRLAVGVDLFNARTRLIGASGIDRVGGENEKVTFRDLSLPSKPEARFVPLGSFDLLNAANGTSTSESSSIVTAETNLRKSILELMHRVTANQHERWALAVACLLMILTGALTALKFQNSMPLTVYLWSFIPALACIVTISGGQQTVIESGAPGLILLWGGIAGLGTYAFLVYRTVARH
jgi:lipopolysaccharide export LptBFGC system permease protein LptF